MEEYVEGVDQPAHYGGKDYPYQPWHVIEAWGLNFFTGTAVKYIGRAGKKPGESYTKDLQKAIRFLHRELEIVEEREVRSQPQQSDLAHSQSRHQQEELGGQLWYRRPGNLGQEQEIIERRNAIAHKMDIPDVEVIAEDESQS